jgi:hypothetical protein
MTTGAAPTRRGPVYDIDTTQPPPLELLDIDLDEPTSCEPAPPATADRRRIGAVVALVAVVVSAVLAWSILRNGAAGAAAPVVLEQGRPAMAAGIPGFAELYLSTYLTAAGSDRDAAIRAFHPTAPPSTQRPTADRYVVRIVTLDVSGEDPHWTVALAAEVLIRDDAAYVPDGIHHYLVGVTHSGGRLAATSLPARVAGPPPAPVPAVVTGRPIDDAAMSAMVDGFLRAMLTGQGDLRAYVADDVDLEVLDPPAFRSLAPAVLSSTQSGGAVLDVRAVTTGVPNRGAPLDLEYHLVVESRSGSWVVTDLTAGPPPAADAAGS